SEGATEAEIDVAVGQLRAIIRGAIGGRPAAASQAGELLQRALDGMPQLEPREGLRAFDVLLQDLEPAAGSAQFERDWSGRGPLVTVAGPDPVPEAAVRAALTAAPPAPPAKPGPALAATSRPRSSAHDAPLRHGEELLAAGRSQDARREFDEIL